MEVLPRAAGLQSPPCLVPWWWWWGGAGVPWLSLYRGALLGLGLCDAVCELCSGS